MCTRCFPTARSADRGHHQRRLGIDVALKQFADGAARVGFRLIVVVALGARITVENAGERR
jgi:hypothetical protein